MKRMACLAALAAGSGLALSSATTPASAEPAPYFVAKGLQLSLTAPSAYSGDALNLDVNFSGANIRSVELYMDGALIKHQAIRTIDSHGVISFALDGMLITEGAHEMLVKAVDKDGNTASASTRFKVAPEDNNSLVRTIFPKKNATVLGVVPIQISVDSSIHNPYVIFLLDNEFLSLTNYAPFVYNWDSTTSANGPHILSVKTYDGDTTNEVKGVDLKVRVNNPGGFTKRQTETPDLNTSLSRTKVQSKVIQIARGAASSSEPVSSAGTLQGSGALERMVLARDPSLRYYDVTKMRSTSSRPEKFHGTAAAQNSAFKPAPISTPKQMLLAMLAEPTEHSSEIAFSAESLGLLRQSLRLHRPASIAAQPSMALSVLVATPNAHFKTAHARSSVSSQKALVGAGSLNNISASTFEVAFDDTKIAFDVPPRVEHGLPLAPFRAIFEHTGGTVKWYGKSKTVHAYNSTREIEFQVGKSDAKVNNHLVKLEVKPTLTRGRTIVPLSFVRDSLDVNVSYDPKSGYLRIDRKR